MSVFLKNEDRMMVLYSYYCKKCDLEIDMRFRMGKAPKSIKCKDCGKRAERILGFSVIVPDPVSDARIDRGSG